MTIHIKRSVLQQIPTTLAPDDLEVVKRCISHYSQSCISDIGYRMNQWYNSSPDWTKSAQLLEMRDLKSISGNGAPGNYVVANVLFAPFALLDYVFQESGTAKLKRLIEENSQ